MKSLNVTARPNVRLCFRSRSWRGIALAAALAGFLCMPASGQEAPPSTAVIVQPGAPGKPSVVLPPSTRAMLPPRSDKDIEFMRGMIMHHAQAVEMTAMITSRTENKKLRLLGARISQSQSDEMRFMKRWLEMRGAPITAPMAAMPGMDMPGMDMSGHNHHMLMPGMLTAAQMEALRKAKGAEFDRLFLVGMIQHHGGALTMVEELFNTAGAGQDGELFDFATDADNTQRAEIKIMQNMLEKNR